MRKFQLLHILVSTLIWSLGLLNLDILLTVSHRGLNLHFWIANDVRTFACAYLLCGYPLWTREIDQISCPLKQMIVLFLKLIFKIYFHRLDANPLSSMWLCVYIHTHTHIYIHTYIHTWLVCGLSFQSLNNVFQKANVLNFDKIQFIDLFVLFIDLLVLYWRNLCLI